MEKKILSTNEIFILQDGKDASKLQTAYIFKGLGRNLIPSKPTEQQLNKMKNCIKNMLKNQGQKADEEAVNAFIGRLPKIGLVLSLRERKLVNALTVFIGNSTLMDRVQKNKYLVKNRKGYKATKIDYTNIDFKISVRDMNKLFGRSIEEKTKKGDKNIVEKLSSEKFFLINHLGEIKYELAFPMIIKDGYLKFKFNSFLIGRSYDNRKNFFDNIKTVYEAIFFELLFSKTKDYRKKPIDKFIFTTRSILEDLGLEELVKTHRDYVMKILNTCFSIAFEKGVFTVKFEYKKEDFKKVNKTSYAIPINSKFNWI